MPKPRSLTPTPLPGDPADPQGFAALGEAYFDWMRVKNYSERTITNRRNYLRYFAQWCEERGLTQPAGITPPLLELLINRYGPGHQVDVLPGQAVDFAPAGTGRRENPP